MTNQNLETLSNAELVERFTTLSLKQFDAEYEEDGVRAYTRLYHAIHATSGVLRARGVEARMALIPLLKHPNARVRLNAAHELLAVVPSKAHAVLKDLAETAPGPQRFRARLALRFLDEGVYKPT